MVAVVKGEVKLVQLPSFDSSSSSDIVISKFFAFAAVATLRGPYLITLFSFYKLLLYVFYFFNQTPRVLFSEKTNKMFGYLALYQTYTLIVKYKPSPGPNSSNIKFIDSDSTLYPGSQVGSESNRTHLPFFYFFLVK